MMTRFDGRDADALRPVKMCISEYLLHPEGSVLIQVGNTKVICTATVEDKVPGFCTRTGQRLDYS
ncbi:Ribonuclease PH OS=Lysinibacillus sphaericus OX=1421 GN=rph PE=3 SV=1 [Lysinibacillus sphaericus]